MTSITTTRVTCPAAVAPCAGKCGGEAVEATYGAKSVIVEPCSFVLAQGWTGPGVVLWHNQALQHLVPVTPAAVRHTDGLVALG